MLNRKLLVAVGSRQDQVCSVGAFARAEAAALSDYFTNVQILEPDTEKKYPITRGIEVPDVILFHAPSLHDRLRPWYPLKSALMLRAAFPKSKFISLVHEFSDAPAHWKIRQIAITKLATAVVVNSEADETGMSRWHSRLLRIPLGPTLSLEGLPKSELDLNRNLVESAVRNFRKQVFSDLNLAEGAKLIVHPGLVTPGKGVNSLEQMLNSFENATKNFHLVVVGGFGPKERDRVFAMETTRRLSAAAKGRFSFIESPSDVRFQQLLTAADLVVLPYDEGVSERRSSFLSSMWSAANVWITTGNFSAPLRLESSAAHSVSKSEFQQSPTVVSESIKKALAESYENAMERRLKNLNWAYQRSWGKRSEKFANFVEQLFVGNKN